MTGWSIYLALSHPNDQVDSPDSGKSRIKSGSLVTPDVVPSMPAVTSAPVSKGPSKIMKRLVRETRRAEAASSLESEISFLENVFRDRFRTSPAPKVAPLASKADDSKSASSLEASEATEPTLSDSFKTHIRLWVEHAFEGYSEYYRRRKLFKPLKAAVAHLEDQLKKVHDEPPFLDHLEGLVASYKKAGKPYPHIQRSLEEKRSKIRRKEVALEQGKRHQRERVDALLDLDKEFRIEKRAKFQSIKNKYASYHVDYQEFEAFVEDLIDEFKSTKSFRKDGVDTAENLLTEKMRDCFAKMHCRSLMR